MFRQLTYQISIQFNRFKYGFLFLLNFFIAASNDGGFLRKLVMAWHSSNLYQIAY